MSEGSATLALDVYRLAASTAVLVSSTEILSTSRAPLSHRGGRLRPTDLWQGFDPGAIKEGEMKESFFRTVTTCMVAVLAGTLFMSVATAIPFAA